MSEHRAAIHWRHSAGEFVKGTYSREHTWSFDGGAVVPASPSPHAVRLPFCNPANVDPEEAYVASLASCHMLTFLYLASRQKIEIVSYDDDAVGILTPNERGVPWVSEVVLRPRIDYGAAGPPAREIEERLHHDAHEQCYIANSVRKRITVEPAVTA